MSSKYLYSVILLLFVLSAAACTGKRTEKNLDGKQNTGLVEKPVSAAPAESLTSLPAASSAAHIPSETLPLDTTGTVKGYQTQKYLIPVDKDGIYTVTLSSKNLQLIFVIQDAQGNNVIDETSPAWTGELKKGEYTLIVGLMRNAARQDPDKEIKYSLQIKRNS